MPDDTVRFENLFLALCVLLAGFVAFLASAIYGAGLWLVAVALLYLGARVATA